MPGAKVGRYFVLELASGRAGWVHQRGIIAYDHMRLGKSTPMEQDDLDRQASDFPSLVEEGEPSFLLFEAKRSKLFELVSTVKPVGYAPLHGVERRKDRMMIPPSRLSFPGPHHDRESEEENTRERVSQHFFQYMELVGDPLRPPSVVPQRGSVASSTRVLLPAQGATAATGPMVVPLPATEVVPGPVPYSQLVDPRAPYGTPFLGGCHLTRLGMFVTNRRGRTLPTVIGSNPFPWALRAVSIAARRY